MKRVTLEAWAEANFDPPPTIATLRAWARQQRIQPAPIKVGRTWYVAADAQYGAPESDASNGVAISGMSDRAAAILRAA